MPILPLDDLSTPEGRALSLFRTVAVMGSPNDPDERSEYLVARSAKAMSEAPDAAYEALFHEQGGFGGVAEARPFSTLTRVWFSRMDDWFVTSQMANLLWRLSIGPKVRAEQCSVNKAAYVIERQRERGSADAIAATPKNRNDIVKIWGRYRSVAHLCTAVVTASGQDEIPNSLWPHWLQLIDRLPYILGLARRYQHWGLSQQLPRIARTVLTKSDLWQIPDALLLPEVRVAMAPLQPEEIQLLREYRAPVPQH